MSSLDVLYDTYDIIEEIGSGGGGVVYHAVHKRLQTDVVVKKIKDEVVSKIKGRQEADVLKKLKHPYLPRVYDFIETDDGIYTVMDYIKGQNLEEAMSAHGAFSQEAVRKWAIQLGEALDYLHKQNPPIIHSDIKPANIMLTPEGDICLIDFNISLAVGNDQALAVGVSAGFSPPEQYADAAMYGRLTNGIARAGMRQGDLKPNVIGGSVAKPVSASSAVDDDRTVLLDDEGKTQILAPIASERKVPVKKIETVPLPIMPKGKGFARYEFNQYFGTGISTRSDIFSLGMCLISLLYGMKPNGDFGSIPIIDPAKIRISEGFADIINKMVRINPAERYKDGSEFLDAVRNCHKLDHRYISMHRKETVLKIVSIIVTTIGILVMGIGAVRHRSDLGSEFYSGIAEIEELINEGEYDDAYELLMDMREKNNVASLYKEEVYLLFAEGNYEDCIRKGEDYVYSLPFYVETDEDTRQVGEIYYCVGNAYYEMGIYSNACRAFDTALEMNPDNPNIYRDYALTLARNNEPDKAKKILKKADKLNLSDDSSDLVLGEIAAMNGDYEDALDYFEKCYESSDANIRLRSIKLSDDVYAKSNLGVDAEIAFLEKKSKERDMIGKYEIKDRLASAYIYKAGQDESFKEEYYNKALEIFYESYNSGYKTLKLLHNIGVINETLGNMEEAGDIYTEMANLYPDRYEVYVRLAFYEADCQQQKANESRDYTKMKEYYDKAMKLYDYSVPDDEVSRLSEMMSEVEYNNWLSE